MSTTSTWSKRAKTSELPCFVMDMKVTIGSFAKTFLGVFHRQTMYAERNKENEMPIVCIIAKIFPRMSERYFYYGRELYRSSLPPSFCRSCPNALLRPPQLRLCSTVRFFKPQTKTQIMNLSKKTKRNIQCFPNRRHGDRG